MAQPQALAHHLAPQVDITVAQPNFLIDGLVQLERQRIGSIQQLQLRGHDLDAARCQTGVDGSFGARAHRPAYAHDEFVPQFLRDFEYRAGARIEHDLHQAFAIAQIDEYHPAMIASAMNPAGNADALGNQLLINLSAVVGSHGFFIE